jgi:predicted nucleic acid-binding protein
VHREIAQTDLLIQHLEIGWIRSPPGEPLPDDALLEDAAFQALGSGEQACVVLARTLADALLLTNDHLARRFAESFGITVVNIPAFLLACKIDGLVGRYEMAQVVEELRAKDYYEFKAEVRALLLA